nr:DUF4143 domain-containing protein [Gammaproteobacteria bacterium]
IRDLAKVGDENAFLQFLRLSAARTGQVINMASLARDAGVSPNTAKNWLSILQTSGIIYLLQPYYNNFAKRMIKSPKLYFLDTGLCSYLTQWSDAKTLEAGAMSGNILETYVVMEIIKSYWHNGLEAPLYYYRDKDMKEVDLMIIKNQTVYPIEIKKTAAPSQHIAKQFNVLKSLKMEIGPGCIICLVDSILPISASVNAVPVSLV